MTTDTRLRLSARAIGKRRFALLLGTLIVLLLIAPLFGDGPDSEAGLAALFSLIVLGFATAARRTGIALVVAGAWLVLTWFRPLGDGAAGEVADDVALLIICVVTIESALSRAFGAKRIDTEVLCAAIAAYMLLGVACAALYTMLESVHPGAFALSAGDAARPWNALLYFSFTTLTTLGYGDVLPAIPIARALATVQAVAGTLYLAILIARLVGTYGAERNG